MAGGGASVSSCRTLHGIGQGAPGGDARGAGSCGQTAAPGSSRSRRLRRRLGATPRAAAPACEAVDPGPSRSRALPPTRGVPALREGGGLGAPPGLPAWLSPPASCPAAEARAPRGRAGRTRHGKGGRWRRERSCKSHDFPAYINHSLFFSTGCRLKGAVSSFSPKGRVSWGTSGGPASRLEVASQWEGQGLGFREPSAPTPSSGLFPSSWRPGKDMKM